MTITHSYFFILYFDIHLLFLYLYVHFLSFFSFFFNDTPTTEIYTLSLHDALPIAEPEAPQLVVVDIMPPLLLPEYPPPRSEEHTSELQSHVNLVCRLLLEKKKKKI